MFARIGVMRGIESMARYQKGNPELTAPRPDAWQAKAAPGLRSGAALESARPRAGG